MPKPTRSRIALVEAMPATPTGASLAPICKTTGWQADSARAAGSGLRQSGHDVDRANPTRETDEPVYRIVLCLEATG